MNLLQELVSITEFAKKRTLCTMKATKKIADELVKSDNIRESLNDIFSTQLNEGKSVGDLEKTDNGTILRLFDDFENPHVAKIAKALGLHDRSIKKIADKCFAVYIHNHSLTFYKDPTMYDEDE